jgi:hypothetical protein
MEEQRDNKMYQRNKIVKHYFRTIAVLAVSLMGSALVPALKADEWDRKTNIKIDQSIEVQGTVLPPGSYVMKLLDFSADRRIVQIFNADEDHLIVTVLAIPAYRLTPTGDSEFKFYKGVEGRPPVLRRWFYPGDNVGFELRSGRGEMMAQSRRRHTNPTISNTGGD